MPLLVKDQRQQALFPDSATKLPALPTLDVQTDIKYYGTRARSVLNRPEATGMDFWSINPYIGCALGCTYCYARYAHGYALDRAANANPDHREVAADVSSLPPWLAFERRILVKENAPAVLQKTLRTGSDRHLALIAGESITIGTATDPYQPAERRFRITRQILQVIAEHPGLDCRIITKSPLVTRDIDLLKRINRHSRIHIHMSLITTDRDLARRIEPRAPTPDARLRAVRRLRESGIDVGVNVMPILPGITDKPAQLDELVRKIADTGATHIAACALRLRHAARKRYLPWINEEFPHLAARYASTYENSFHAGDNYREGLTQVMTRLCRRYRIRYGTFDADEGDLNSEAADSASDQLALGFDRAQAPTERRDAMFAAAV
jgi:DNA repair photolyase